MRAKWRRDLDETDLNLAEIQRQQSMRLSHAMGMHRKLPRQSCSSCKEERAAQWQKAERPDRVNDLTVNDRRDSALLSGTIPTEVRN